MSDSVDKTLPPGSSLLMSESKSRWLKIKSWLGQSFLLLITSLSVFAVMFIILFIAKDGLRFFFPDVRGLSGLKQMFTSTEWYPTREPAIFGALSLFFGTFIVTVGAVIIAVPLGISAAVCLSDLLPFKVRQLVKPVIEILAAIPSVVYGFFAYVVLARWLSESGNIILSSATWLVGGPIAIIGSIVIGDIIADRYGQSSNKLFRFGTVALVMAAGTGVLAWLSHSLYKLEIPSGTNALNASIILGFMALPTIVSVSEDALQAAGREIREGSYALGATRAETLIKAVIPASISGILAAVILGIMRAVGETMVVWMASGGSAKIPAPFWDLTQSVRTITATIAGEMGEADHSAGASHYHVLFALAFFLLIFSLLMNMLSEWIIVRSRKKLRG